MEVSSSGALQKTLLSTSLVLLLAVATNGYAKTEIGLQQSTRYMAGSQYAHNWMRGGHRHYGIRTWRGGSRYYWRTMKYRCHGPKCYKRKCLYRRGVSHPIRCKVRRWWRW